MLQFKTEDKILNILFAIIAKKEPHPALPHPTPSNVLAVCM
jgi:hypothetical protein